VAISSGKNKQTRGEKPCHKTMDMKPWTKTIERERQK
jgi:hypothetical protein